MKGLFIVGQEMPRGCGECWNCDCNFTGIGGEKITEPMCLCAFQPVDEIYNENRPEWCPLIEVEIPDTDELNYKQAVAESGKQLMAVMIEFNKKFEGEI